MMRRSRYLVSYDIRDPKRLRRVAKTMLSYGSRLQYSVFVCDVSAAELVQLRFDLRDTLEPEDSVMIVPLGPGYDTSCFEFLGPPPALPEAGSVIV